MDKTCRPESTSEQLRKNAKQVKVDAIAYKLDQVANWHEWGQVLGLRLKGLRRSDFAMNLAFVLPKFVPYLCGFNPFTPNDQTRICWLSSLLLENGSGPFVIWEV